MFDDKTIVLTAKDLIAQYGHERSIKIARKNAEYEAAGSKSDEAVFWQRVERAISN